MMNDFELAIAKSMTQTKLDPLGSAAVLLKLALSIYHSSLKDKVFHTAKCIPDFIILNLKKTDVIIENMSMRGLGTEKRRSIYPYLKFKVIDFFLCLILLTSIIMVHSFA